MIKDNIDILLCVYNGSRQLKEQIESILGQTYDNWRLLIRDDGSIDNTSEIINAYKDRYPAKIRVILDREPGKNINLGACQGFGQVLQKSTARYSMFCDQDDVWQPGKINKTLKKMQDLEAIYHEATPIMVHTDLTVVDKNLYTISESFWKFQGLAPEKSIHLNRLLMQNGITGCTVMINQQLRELAMPIPPEAIMHDYWLALVAAAFGKIAYLNEPTILYRQHEANYAGAKKYNIGFILKKAIDNSFVKGSLSKKQRQATVFYQRYREELSKRQQELLEDFLALGSKGFWQNRCLVLKNRFFPIGLGRNVGLFVYI